MAKIHIEIDTIAGDNLDDVFGEFGFFRRDNPEVQRDDQHKFYPNPDAQRRLMEAAAAGQRARDVPPTPAAPGTGYTEETKPQIVNITSGAPLGPYDGERKRGEALPPGRRRTNAQIESDKLYFDQEHNKESNGAAALAAMDKGVHGQHEMKIEGVDIDHSGSAASFTISSGAERVNLEDKINAQDLSERAQDAADEAAEIAAFANVKGAGEPTLEDLRAVAAAYAHKFGIKNQITDMRRILGCAIIDVPKDEIAAAIARVQAALAATNIDEHLAKTSEPEKPAAPRTATKDELVQAMLAYGKKYDGSIKPDEMTFTKEDLPKVFGQVFGAGVTGLGSMPGAAGNDFSKITPENFGRVVAAVEQATTANPFKREVRK